MALKTVLCSKYGMMLNAQVRRWPGWGRSCSRCPSGRSGTSLGVVVVVHREAELLEVVDALRAPGGLAGGLDGRQQQGDQDRDDRDHDQQLDQGETARRSRGRTDEVRFIDVATLSKSSKWRDDDRTTGI